MSSVASPSLKELLAEVRAWVTCPCGEWVYGPQLKTYRISWKKGPDGGHNHILEFEEGHGQDRIFGSVVPADDAWKWSAHLTDAKGRLGTMNLHFQDTGMMQSSMRWQDSKGPYVASAQCTGLRVYRAEVGETIASCVHQILSVHSVRTLGQSVKALHATFELLDGYNKRLEALTGVVNPTLWPVLEPTARSTASVIRSSTWPNIDVTVLAAHVMRCLCQRQSQVGEESLHECQALFSSMLLDWEAIPLRTSLNSLAKMHLKGLWEQLQGITGTEAASDVDHIGLLQLAGATAACLQQTLPMQEQRGKKLNLEHLISQCHRQYSTEDCFLQQVGPRLAEAVPAGTTTNDEAAQRLACCVKYAVELRGELHNWTAVWKMATACSPSEPLLTQVVLKLCGSQPPALDPAPDLVYEVLWPLLDQDLPTETVQELLQFMVQQRIARGWEASAILSGLRSLVEEGSRRCRRVAWHKVAQVALASGAQSCASENTARQMFHALSNNPWLDSEDLCALCTVLTTAMGVENTSQLAAAAWVPLITKCRGPPPSTQRTFPALDTLLHKVLLDKPKTAAELVAFLRELRVEEVFQGELPDAVHKAAAQTKPYSVALDILLGSGQRDMVADLFLKHWVAGVDAAPPGSAAESEFLAWVKDSNEDVSRYVTDLRLAQKTATNQEPMLLLRAHAARRIQHAWRRYVAVLSADGSVDEQDKESSDATVAKLSPDSGREPENSTLESNMKKCADVGVQWLEPDGMQGATKSIEPLSLLDDEVASGQAWEMISHCTSASLLSTPSASRRGRKNEVDRFVLEVADVQNLDVEGRRLPLPDFEPSPNRKCSESFLEGAKLLVPEHLEHLMDSACKACKGTLKSMVKQAGSLELQELFAVLLFLFDVRLVNPAAPASASFYSLLRHVVREREQVVLVPLNDYLCYLQSGLKKLPVEEGPIYCGVPAEASTALEEFQEGEKVGWSTFISLTPVLRVAKDAAGPEGAVLGVKSKTARNLSSINQKADPSHRCEAVLLPGTRLTVGCKERSGDIWLFCLEECNFDEAEDSDDIDV